MSKKIPVAQATIPAAWVAGALGCLGVAIAAIIGLGIPFVQGSLGQTKQKPTVIEFRTPTPQFAWFYQIEANKGWQDTRVKVSEGNRVIVEYLSGHWFEDPPGKWYDAAGKWGEWICSFPLCFEQPLPDFSQYALIGKIGDSNSFLRIGRYLDFVAEDNGGLASRPNYGDVDMAYFNPSGKIVVKLTIY